LKNPCMGFLCVLLTAFVLLAPGCGWFGGAAGPDPQPVPGLVKYGNQGGDGYFYRQPERPEAVREWVDNAAHHVFLGQSRVFDDYLYILVTYGPQPTGGFAVEITDVRVGADAVNVVAAFRKPEPGENVTQAFTYPYDLVLVPAVDLPVMFSPAGDEEYLMTLYGADYLEPISASSFWIKLIAPAEGDTATGSLLFRGVASVFEGTINYRLTDKEGLTLVEEIAQAGMGDWYYFEEVISLAGLIREGQTAVLELFTISPKDGTEQNEITLTLNIAP